MNIRNLFDNLRDRSDHECFDTVLQTPGFKLERIVSTGQASPPGQWYDQDRDEWILLVTGSAGIKFEGEPGEHMLRTGDYLVIPAHRKHRVEWTSSHEPTVWLALHFA